MTDNAMFTSWLSDFEAALIECGMAKDQAAKYRGEHYNAALSHYADGRTVDEAAGYELMKVM